MILKQFLVLLATLMSSWGVAAGLLVTDIVGMVETDTKSKLAVMVEVTDGTSLQLEEGSRMVAVDLATGKEFSFRGPGRYLVEKDGPRTLKGTPVDTKSLPALKSPNLRIAPAKVSQATLVMRGGLKISGVVLESPVRTSVLLAAQRFSWLPVNGAVSYHFIIQDDQGNQKFESTVVSGTELILPPEAGLASGSRYKWRVEAIGTQGGFADAAAEFSVVPKETAERLAQFKPDNTASFARRVLYATLLQDAGVRDESRAIWKKLAEERPEDEAIADLAR